jgi:hypothetical protein
MSDRQFPLAPAKTPRRRFILYAAALLLLLAMASSISADGDKGSVDPAATLPAEMRAIMDQPKYRGARWGIYVADRKSGQVIYDLNGSQFFVPGSTTKLFSTAARRSMRTARSLVSRHPSIERAPSTLVGGCGAIWSWSPAVI